ncbi:Protein EI24 homolog [Linum perenne]
MGRFPWFTTKVKQILFLWLEGFLEACCLHRVFILCRRSKQLSIRTGQCFLLNGFIFLGRYNDIAKYGFAAMGESGSNLLKPSSSDEVTVSENKAPMNKLPGLEGVIVGIGEQVYSALLLTFFFLQVSVVGLMPFVGKTFSFVLLSWMYKWNLSEVPLDRRLDFFETNWAFFAGFGSPCVLAIFFVSPLVSYGVMAILYPLFVLAATSSSAEQLILLERKKWKGVGLGRLPIFCVADTLSLRILSFLPLESRQEQANKKPN